MLTEQTPSTQKLADFSILQELNNSHTNSKAYGTNPNSRLWKPVKLGNQLLEHRVALAPLTRMRSPNHVPLDIVAEHYGQRATKGGLLVSEATFIAREAGGYPNAPGIFNQEQIAQWKKVTDAVHAKGGIIYCQLWAIGFANTGSMPDVKIVSSGTTPYKEGGVEPEQMAIEDIQRYLKHYEHAAKCAIEAGFDGCEVHGAHGYLLEQFLNPKINCTRNDIYSGPVENRARFMLEALKTVADAIGPERTAIRISPFSPYGGRFVVDPWEHWGYVCEQITIQVPKLAYVSVTDPRLDNGSKTNSSDFFRAIFRGYNKAVSKLSAEEHLVTFPEPDEEHPTVFFCAGGYTASDAEECSERTGDVIGYGRLFISNPDLVHRLKNGLELNPYDRSTFYGATVEGYNDYPYADEKTRKFVPLSDRNGDDILKEVQAYVESTRAQLFTLKSEKVAATKQKEEDKAKIEELESKNKDLKDQIEDLLYKVRDLETKSKTLEETLEKPVTVADSGSLKPETPRNCILQ